MALPLIISLVPAVIGFLGGLLAGEKTISRGNTDRYHATEESQKTRDWHTEERRINNEFHRQQAELDKQFREKESTINHERLIKITALSHKNHLELQQVVHFYQIALENFRNEHQRELIYLQNKQAEETRLAKQKFELELASSNYRWALESSNKQAEFARDLRYWPLRNRRSQLSYDPVSVTTIPLNIFLINTANTSIQDFDVSIGADLRQFVTQLNSHDRQVEFFDKAWLDGVPGGGAAVKILESFLRSMPTLILEVEFFNQGEQRFFNLNFAYWGLDPGYCYSPLLSKIACNSFATDEELMQSISLCLRFLAGMCTDAHYIKHYAFAPILPHLLPHLLDVNQPDASPVVEQLVETYCKVLENLGDENRFLIPEWLMAIAKEVTYIPRLAREVADMALENLYKTKQKQLL